MQEQLIDLTKHIAKRKLKKIDDLIKAQEIDVADLASFGLKEDKLNPFQDIKVQVHMIQGIEEPDQVMSEE